MAYVRIFRSWLERQVDSKPFRPVCLLIIGILMLTAASAACGGASPGSSGDRDTSRSRSAERREAAVPEATGDTMPALTRQGILGWASGEGGGQANANPRHRPAD